LIDEFSSLGRIERLRRSLKLLREYRVRCILMFQYIAQTYEKYSHEVAVNGYLKVQINGAGHWHKNNHFA